MKCPECLKLGIKSRVYVGDFKVSKGHIMDYFDEDGFYHIHDTSATTTDYACSSSHSWSETKVFPCWCKWGEEKK